MRAILLVAGRGSRLKHLTNDHPKCMVQLHGKPLIAHQIQALQAAGIQTIAAVTGYQSEKIQAEGLTERFTNPHWQTSNMVRSLMMAEPWLSSSDCIISYGDIFYEPSAITSLMTCQAPIAITYDTHYLETWSKRFANPLDDLESFKLNAKQQLIEIGKKPNTLDDVQGQYMGLLKFSKDGWISLQHLLSTLSDTAINQLDMTSFLNLAITHGLSIQALPYSGAWGEIDHESDLKLYEHENALS